MSDFIAPKETQKTDYMGAFCVGIFGAQELADSYKAKEDDYNAIMAQAIADRFAEAMAEYLHKQIRTKHWGYDAGEALTNDDLIKEEIQRNTTSTRLSCVPGSSRERNDLGTISRLRKKLESP